VALCASEVATQLQVKCGKAAVKFANAKLW